MEKTKENKSGGGFMSLLTLLFIGLKLTNQISWSWIWVLSPIWGSILLWIIAVFILVALKKVGRNK